MGEPNINEAFLRPVGGYGRVFEAMYNGSMYGAGVTVFAVWPYVISHMRGHPEHGALVELNPVPLVDTFGKCRVEDIEKAIKFLCAPDPNSRSKAEEGRRLVKMGQFLYRVVNGAEYMKIRKDEANRAKHQAAQDRYRKKRKVRGAGTTAAERAHEAAEGRGDFEEARRIEEIQAGVAPGSFAPQKQSEAVEANPVWVQEVAGDEPPFEQ